MATGSTDKGRNWLTRREAARELGVTSSWVSQLIRRGRLTADVDSEGRLLVHVESVRVYAHRGDQPDDVAQATRERNERARLAERMRREAAQRRAEERDALREWREHLLAALDGIRKALLR